MTQTASCGLPSQRPNPLERELQFGDQDGVRSAWDYERNILVSRIGVIEEQVLRKQKTQRVLGRENRWLKSHKGTWRGHYDRGK